ncbi:(4Fe-4S)-binding protein [Marinilabiliaceae bacterium JC017]|nr:(4Fe-4S)-binding protein [Marinilabiliaceae bacterium JC017]
MQEITILSGKGGTGKTTITAALASLAPNAVFCDNDVDAADLFLILQPQTKESHAFESGWVAHINPDTCTQCGLCQEQCRYDAISNDSGKYEINPFLCEGCRLCERLCPSEAIHSVRNQNNTWYVSDSRFGPFVHAKMGAGEENSGKLVTRIRRKAKEIAREINADFIVSDGPPGIGCPVIASLTGTNKVLIVIEPSQSGLHDAQRLITLIESFNIPTYAIINKYDINKRIAQTTESYLQDKGIPLIGKIPFDPVMTKSMMAEKTIVEYQPDSSISEIIQNIWKQLN